MNSKLLAFWLPFRKSNFINMVDNRGDDNLLIRVKKFLSHGEIEPIDNIMVNIHSTNYNAIFQYGNCHDEIVGKYIFDSNIDCNMDIDCSGDRTKIQCGDIAFEFKKGKLSSAINHLQFKFKIREYSEQTFQLFIDEYGFYFIDIESSNEEELDLEELKEKFNELLFSFDKNENTILTNDQWYIINGGLLFEYQNDRNKIDDFFKSIIRIYKDEDFKYENRKFDILPKKELEYILDKRNDEELQERIYMIPFIHNSYDSLGQDNVDKLVREWILNTEYHVPIYKQKFLYKLFLQDQIEKNGMKLFLDVATSIKYIGYIINDIKGVRDKLRELIHDTTEVDKEFKIDTQIGANKYEYTEDRLARYIEQIFAQIPNLKTIDTFLQEAYYIKIGNYSFVSYIEDSENITTSYQYIKWKNLIDNIFFTASSLEIILKVYQNRQSLEELEELRQNELSTSDKNDVQNISNKDSYDVSLSKPQEDFIVVFGFLIAFSSLYNDIWDKIHHVVFELLLSTDNPFIVFPISLIIGIGMIFVLKIFLPYIYKIIFIKKGTSPIKFFGINTVELRSKRILDIEHKYYHDFTKNMDDFINKIENYIDIPNKNTLLGRGRRRILFTRLNPRNRKIKIKYIFDKDLHDSFFNLNILGIKRSINNRNIKIKFFVVYTFALKLNKKDEMMFHVYNNSIKVFFNIGTIGKFKMDSLYRCEDVVRKRLYQIFIKNFNQNGN